MGTRPRLGRGLRDEGRGVGGIVSFGLRLAARDALDRTRKASPLAVAGDAVQVDTTGVPIEEVVARVLAVVERIKHAGGQTVRGVGGGVARSEQ